MAGALIQWDAELCLSTEDSNCPSPAFKCENWIAAAAVGGVACTSANTTEINGRDMVYMVGKRKTKDVLTSTRSIREEQTYVAAPLHQYGN